MNIKPSVGFRLATFFVITSLVMTVMGCSGSSAISTGTDEPPYVEPIPQGPSFYIAPNGDDVTGDGSQAHPWKTLFKATLTVDTPDAVIRVLPGTYIETQTSDLKVGVHLEGSGDTSIIQSTLSDPYIPILRALSPEGTLGNQHISKLKFDGSNLKTAWGILVAGRSQVNIHDVTIVDFEDRGVIFSARTDGIGAPPNSKYAKNNRFYNNTLHNSASYNSGYGRGGLNIGGQEGMRIYKNTISQMGRPKGSNGWPIKGYNEGYLRDLKIYDNTITKAPFDGAYPGENNWDFAIELFNVSGTEIFRNTIQGSLDTNFQTKGIYPYGISIHDNVIGHPTLNTNPESGIILEFGTQSAIIANNTIRNVQVAVLFSLRPGSEIKDVTIRNNLMVNLGQAGFGHGTPGGSIVMNSDEKMSYAIENMFIFNNTIVANPTDNPWWGMNLSWAKSIRNLQIKNNISQNFNASWLSSNSVSVMTNVVIANNDNFGNTRNEPNLTDGSSTNYTFSNNISVDPEFVSATDYRAAAVRDLGVDVGLPFKGIAPDIGYIEY
jgi:hypothetical protein